MPWNGFWTRKENGMGGDAVALEHEGDIRWALGEKEVAKVWQRALGGRRRPEGVEPQNRSPVTASAPWDGLLRLCG